MGRRPNRSPVILAVSAEASMDEQEAWLLQMLKDGEDPGEDLDTPRLGSPAVTTQASQPSSSLTSAVSSEQQRAARRPRARTCNDPFQVATAVAATKTHLPEKVTVPAAAAHESLEAWLHANGASSYKSTLCSAFGTVENLVAFAESASDLYTNFAIPRQQAVTLWNAIELERTQRDETQERPFSGLGGQMVSTRQLSKPELEPEPEPEPQQAPERSQPFRPQRLRQLPELGPGRELSKQPSLQQEHARSQDVSLSQAVEADGARVADLVRRSAFATPGSAPRRGSPERPRTVGGVSSLQQGHEGTTHPQNAWLLLPEQSAAVALRKRQRERRMRAEQRRVAIGAEVHKHVLARATRAMQIAEQTMQASLAATAHDCTSTPS